MATLAEILINVEVGTSVIELDTGINSNGNYCGGFYDPDVTILDMDLLDSWDCINVDSDYRDMIIAGLCHNGQSVADYGDDDNWVIAQLVVLDDNGFQTGEIRTIAAFQA